VRATPQYIALLSGGLAHVVDKALSLYFDEAYAVQINYRSNPLLYTLLLYGCWKTPLSWLVNGLYTISKQMSSGLCD